MNLSGITFKQFISNPLTSLLFMAVLSIGYLYLDNKSTLTNQINVLQDEVIQLKKDYKELNEKFINTIKEMNK